MKVASFILRPLVVVLPLFLFALRVPSAEPLEQILDKASSNWRITRVSGAEHDYRLIDEAGSPALVAGKNGIVLASTTKINADSEVTVRMRLGAAEGKATTVYFGGGLKSPDENEYTQPIFLGLSAPAGVEQEQVLCGMPALPGEKQGIQLPYIVRTLPKQRLSWPDLARARVEEDVASQLPLGKRWLTVRYVVRKNTAQLYLDGRLLRDIRNAAVNPEGHVRISVFEGSQLASVRVRPLPPEDPFFEEIKLDHYINEFRFGGDRVQRDSLPEPGKSKAIDGVPFLFPATDDRGNDHIDVGRSWMRFGLLEGSFDPWNPWLGNPARWRGALLLEPGRIAFRVRNAPYSRLHLIAAFDGEANKTPVVTAQFYRTGAGHPVGFAAQAPLFTARPSQAVPVRLTKGQKGNLHLITIPLEPEGLASLSDEDVLEFELTKETQVYRAYPDPLYYSTHGAGLPSGVHVYAMTLERPAVEADFQPDRYAHIWTAPDQPSYTVRLSNRTSKGQDVQIRLATRSHDGLEKTEQKKKVTVPASGEMAVKLPLELKRYGFHGVEFTMKDGQGERTQTRSLAHLHPDTRERKEWKEGEGPLWGFWDWGGGHGTPGGISRFDVAVAAGIRSSMRPFAVGGHGGYSPEEVAYAEKHGMVTHVLADHFTPSAKEHIGVEWDPSKPAEMGAAVVATLKASPRAKTTATNKPEAVAFFAEPMIGTISAMSFPEYYGDPPYQMTEAEQVNYKKYLDQFLIAGRAIRKEWPNMKLYMPWGIATFPIPFLRHSKEATELMDGPAVDHILFQRLPEMQMHQVTYANVFWQFKQEWIKAGKPWPPRLMTLEGGGYTSPATPGGLTQEAEAERTVRGELLLFPYGITRHLGTPVLFRCAGAWGEQHYGGGMCERMPLLSPKIFYSAYATMTRQLDGMNYVKAVPTGSASVFCLQFKHYKSGELLHIFWTLRGQRPVTLESGGRQVVVHDLMDNVADQKAGGGKATFTISSAPSYVRGLAADAKIELGAPDHRDAKPSKLALRIGNLGDGAWKLSTERDEAYETVNPEYIKKFPGKMSIQVAEAPPEAGGKALSVHLERQEKERKVMPFYTTLVPSQPVAFIGKPSHLGMWVKAASDWGRVVYCLRDAKGERWINVGKKGEWNQDDPNCWSQFCFDGWRYLRFELPGNQPWDKFREMGSAWWGFYEAGDGIVDLPLSLEKIIVERRTHVIKVDELEPANPEDVRLGSLYVEYQREADRGEEAIRLSRLEMPRDKQAPELENPIQKLAASGIGNPTTITKVVPPAHEYDGTRCHVFFEPVPGAKSYDVWVSTYSDGRGAICLGTGWTESGKLLMGLPANSEVFLFVTYTDKDGKVSKPSAGKRILLKDDFPFK